MSQEAVADRMPLLLAGRDRQPVYSSPISSVSQPVHPSPLYSRVPASTEGLSTVVAGTSMQG